MAKDKPVEMNSSPVNRVANLADLVRYQAGAVVSRMTLNKKTGSVTLFAFAEGEGLSEHTAPFDAMVYVLEGESEVTIAGEPFNVKTGDFIIMPANKSHALKAIKAFKMLLIMIRS